MILRHILPQPILIGAIFLLAGCGFGADPPTVGEIQVQPSTTIITGKTATLTIAVSGQELKFEWIAQRGTLSNPVQPSVIYTAPDSAGLDTVTVKVTSRGGEIIRAINFDVVEPPLPTVADTPFPEKTPSPTPIPEPIACNHIAVTKNVFSQIADVEGQFPFYGPLAESRFSCEGVYDIVHSGQLAVRIEYESFGENFGFWGFGTPNGYDASSYNEICFWAYTQKPNQVFRLQIKDTSNKEDGVTIILEGPNRWTQICTDLAKFSDLGIQLTSLENINLGFNKDTDSAEIWVDDFELKE